MMNWDDTYKLGKTENDKELMEKEMTEVDAQPKSM
jgi:hypothetical protein